MLTQTGKYKYTATFDQNTKATLSISTKSKPGNGDPIKATLTIEKDGNRQTMLYVKVKQGNNPVKNAIVM